MCAAQLAARRASWRVASVKLNKTGKSWGAEAARKRTVS